MRHWTVRLLVLASVLGCITALPRTLPRATATGTNFVHNGSVEDLNGAWQNTSGGFDALHSGSTAIANWTVVSAGCSVDDIAWGQTPAGGFHASDGQYFLDLSGFGSDCSPGGAIEQQLSGLTAGQQYIFALDFYSGAFSQALPSVTIGSLPPLGLHTPGTSVDTWSTYSAVFTADSANPLLKLADVTPGVDGEIIDNIIVTPYGQPDLAVSTFAVIAPTGSPPSAIENQQQVSFHTVVSNVGTAAADGHRDAAVLTPDPQIVQPVGHPLNANPKNLVVWSSGSGYEPTWSPGVGVNGSYTIDRSFLAPAGWADGTPIVEGTYALCYVTNFNPDIAELDAPAYANNQLCTPLTLVPSTSGPTGLHFTKTAATQAFVGDPIAYTVSVTNYGPGSIANVAVQDPLPAGLYLVSATPSVGSCAGGGPTVTTASCNLGTLTESPQSGSAVTIQIVAAATTPVPTTYTNAATVTGDGGAVGVPDNGQGSATTAVIYGQATLQPTKTTRSLGGGTLAFDITVLNTGPNTATNVIAKDALQPGLQWVSGICDGQAMPQPQTNAIGCNLGTLTVGQAKVMTIFAQVISPGPIHNVATAHWAGNTGEVSSNIVSSPSAIPTIAKTHQGNFASGANGVYTITVANPSSTDPVLAPLRVTDSLPAGLSFVAGTGSGFTCGASGQTVTCTSSADLAPGTVTAITLTVAATNTTGGTMTVTNQAIVAWAGGVSQPAQDPTSIVAPPKLGVTKTAPAIVTTGHTLTYTLSVSNSGGATAKNVTLSDPLPGGVSFVSSTPANACTGGSTLTCNVGDIAAGSSASLTITVKVTLSVATGATGSLANTATASGDNAPQAQSLAATTTVLPPPDLSVSKTVSAPAVLVGQNLTYTIVARNLGPSSATNVQVIDPLPAGIILVAVTPDAAVGENCNTPAPLPFSNPPQLACTVPVLASGASATAVIVIRTVAPGPLQNTATVSSDDPDPNQANNSATTPPSIVYALPATGQFVIGDNTNHAVGQSVNFWGAQWDKNNPMSVGPGTNAFKGFDDNSQVPACGQTWTTDPGNSAPPPDSIPGFMAIIVSSTVNKSGSTISGDIKQIVIVKTDPGYAGNPGHPGTGTVVATLCS